MLIIVWPKFCYEQDKWEKKGLHRKIALGRYLAKKTSADVQFYMEGVVSVSDNLLLTGNFKLLAIRQTFYFTRFGLQCQAKEFCNKKDAGSVHILYWIKENLVPKIFK